MKKEWNENIIIENVPINCKLDTGADISIMPLHTFNKLNENLNLNLLKTNIKLESFEGNKVVPLGMVNLSCEYNKQKCYENFVIVDCNSMLLGLPGCISLNLIKRVHSAKSEKCDSPKEKFIQDNLDLFKGIGEIPGMFEIPTKNINDQICHPSPRIPNSMHEPLKCELDRLEQRNAIVKVENINENALLKRIVLVERANKKIRLCLDPSDLNKYIVKKPKMLPTLDELASKLNGKVYFSVLDLSEGFHHLKLTEESSWKCCFATPFGVYRYLLLPYGLMNAPELFQDVLESHFGKLQNVVVWADDLLVMGNTVQEHDDVLANVIKKARELGVVFNKEKLQYRQTEVKYVGQIFNKYGMSVDKNRVESLLKLKTPINRDELMRIIGSFNSVRRYVPDTAELMSPLCKLLRKDVDFTWLPAHDKVFNELKEKVSSAPALTPFDPNKKIILQCDASKSGIGCCMFQNDNKNVPRLIACASRTMNDAELNYGQTEKELLAIYFGAKKFHKFIYGHKVDVQTDHKPIVSIMSKHVSTLGSPRIRRLRLKLLIYDLNVYYVPGKLVHFADMLSRNSLDVTEHDNEMLQMVHSVSKYLPMSPERKTIFRNETNNDPLLNKVCNYYYHGWPKDQSLPNECKIYGKFQDKIYLQDGLLFIEDRIIVPSSLKSYVIDVAHKGHFGMNKTISRARQLFYWPNMTQDICDFIKCCRTCEKFSPNCFKEPLLPHKVPKERYVKVGCDILDYGGKAYLTVVDYFSHWLELLPLKSKTAESVIDALQQVFTRFGYPVELISDNVPFSSIQCKQYFKSKDITLITSTPRYPRSNGMAEKAVHICKQILRKCNDDGTDYREGIMYYNNTPLTGLDVSPSQILNSRIVRTSPCTLEVLKPKIQSNVYKKLCLKQSITKFNHDKSARKKPLEFKPGDKIVYRDNNVWKKAIIVKKCLEPRSYLIEREGGGILRRNTSQFKNSFTKSNVKDFKCNDYLYDVENKLLENSMNNNVANNSSPNLNCNNDSAGRTTRSGRSVRPLVRLNL